MVDIKNLYAANPWQPITKKIDLKVLGKMIEELGEAVSAASRCVIQGMDEAEPVSGKVNRAWLEDEAADVLATVGLMVGHFDLSEERILERLDRKARHLVSWYNMP